MTPTHYLRSFVRWWWLVLVLVAVGALLGLAANAAVSSTYTSSVGVLLSPTQAGSVSAADSYSSALLAKTRAPSYARLAESDRVAEDVIERLGLDVDTEQLAELLTVTVPSDTAVISVSVSDDEPERAQQVAQTTAETLVRLVQRVERRHGQGYQMLRADIESPAVVATVPDAAPSPVRNPALGAAGGLLVGLAAAAAAGRLTPRVREDDAVAEALGAPVLGAVPAAGRRRLAIRRTGDDRVLAAVRELRTAVFFRHPGEGRCLTLAVTPAPRVEGRTELTVALASSLVGTGHRVLLVEADLHEPRLTDLLDLDADKTTGLAPYLEGSQEQGEVVHRHASSGLDVIPSGRTSEDPADLLHSPAFVQLLADASERYDYVLLITPSVTVGTDAAAVAAQCDAALVLAARGRTTRQQLDLLARRLEVVGADVLGAVVLG